MTTVLSSAEPEKLLRYGERGLQLDSEIAAQAAQLRGRLEEFERRCTESGCRVAITAGDGALTSHGTEATSLGEWVRSVGRGFLWAAEGEG